MDGEKKPSRKLLQAKCSKEKGKFSGKRRQNGSLNHVLLENIFSREKGTKLFLRGKDNSPSPLGRKQLSPLLPQEI
jgi:hypothetical protein